MSGSNEMFVEKDGKKTDASIHNAILKNGVDDPVAIRKRAKLLGLSEDQIDLIYPDTVSK